MPWPSACAFAKRKVSWTFPPLTTGMSSAVRVLSAWKCFRIGRIWTCCLSPCRAVGLREAWALAAKAINPDIRVIGISMDRGAAMNASIEAGHPVEVTEVASLADSLGGGIGLDNKLSFSLCSTLLDDIVLVTEEEIYRGLQTLYYEDSHIAEGASVVGIAALLANKLPDPKGPVATIVTGRNVDMAQFTEVINGRPVKLGDTLVQGKPYDA